MAEAHKARGVAHVDAPRPTATGLIRRPTSNRRRRWLPVASLVLGIVLLMFKIGRAHV